MNRPLSSVRCQPQHVSPAARQFLSSFTDQTIRRAAADLIEFGIRPKEHNRWFCLGYTNGVELAARNAEGASRLLKQVEAAPGKILRDIVSAHRPVPNEPTLGALHNSALKTTERPPQALASLLDGLGPEAQAAAWFEHTVAAGILAYNHGDLFAGHLRAVLDRLVPHQAFMTRRILAHSNPIESVHPPALVSFFAFSYPHTPIERRVITALAAHLCNSPRRDPLQLRHWILQGFRLGRELGRCDLTTRNALFEEYGPVKSQNVFILLETYFGNEPADWTEQRIYQGSLEYWKAEAPELKNIRIRPNRIAVVRIMFDFALWMGMAAEVQIDNLAGRSSFACN
jgi:hypothetical protein